MRQIHDLERVAGALNAVYAEALADAGREPHTLDEALSAQAAYFQWVNRSFPAPWREEHQDIERQQHAAAISAKAVVIERDLLADQVVQVSAERDAARAEADGLHRDLDRIRAEALADAGRHQLLADQVVQVSAGRDAARAEADGLHADLDRIRSGLLFRRLLPVIWKTRLRLIPDGSARFRFFATLRYRIGCLLARLARLSRGNAPTDAAAVSTHVPEDARLSCVVLDLGGQPSLAAAVRSLASQGRAAEIVVVSSGGGSAPRIVAETGVESTVITSRQRLLPGAARNVGLAASHASHVAFLAGDCVAEAGWVAGRLAAHEAGALAVSSAVTNGAPWNPFAIAAHHLLFPLRLPGTPPAVRLDYGASYARPIFTRYGGFRNDLRIGEDTEFHERFGAEVPVTFRGDVRAAHRNTTTLGTLLRDQYHRGYRAAQAREILYGSSARRRFATNVLRRAPRSLLISLRATPVRGWGKIAWGLPWMPIAAAAYALGAASAAPAEMSAQAPVTAPARRLVCVIAFRNERRFLPGFLANVVPHVDGILALDDGSTDGSGDILAEHPAVRELLRVEPRDPHVWDERRNRRLLIDAAGRHDAEWVIALDADERVECGFRQRAELEMDRAAREGHLAYKLTFRELWDTPDRYRTDGVWGRKQSVRLFRFRRDHDFDARALHGHWAPENSRAPNGDWAAADLIFYHLRMVTAQDRERRKARYLTLDPERRWQSIGYEYLTDERDLRLETFPPGRDYTPLAVEESARVDSFRQELEAVAVREG